MGIDGMRVSGGRCPPLLVIALILVCLMLFFNWWALSSENVELVRQIDELNEQLKISAEERDQCVTLRGSLEQRYKRIEEEQASLHVQLDQQLEYKKKNKELEDLVAACKGELDSLTKLDATRTATLETLRLEKDTIINQLDMKRDENKKLQEEAEKLKGEVDRLKLGCNSPSDKKEPPVLQPVETDSKHINSTSNDAAEQDIPFADDLEDPENRARDNNADEVQSTEDNVLPENYEEEAKAQDTTGKPGDKNI